MTYEAFWKPLTQIYDAGEAKAVTRLVAEVHCGLTLADLLAGKEMTDVDGIHERLLSGEPVQYVLGEADFGPRRFIVTPSVLIPRPETYELCKWIIKSEELKVKSEELASLEKVKSEKCHVLDIGTGSGCIACTLAAELPQAQVTAWDISEKALEIASENAKRTHVHVSFEQVDILSPLTSHPLPPPIGGVRGGLLTIYDLIVSNPPYICESEAAEMEPHVLNYEPAQALFIPNSDPLLFYRHIGNYAKVALHEGGKLYFEINPRFCKDIEQLLSGQGFHDIQVRKDQFGKERFISACK